MRRQHGSIAAIITKGLQKNSTGMPEFYRSTHLDNMSTPCRMLKKAVQQKKTVIWFFWVCLVCLVKQDQQDEQNKPDRPNEQDGLADFFSILLIHRRRY